MMYFACSALIVVLDQALKWLMSSLLPLCQPGRCESIEVLPVFNFTLLHNRGAAFSFLDDAGGWQRWFLVIVSSTASVAIGVWLYRVQSRALAREKFLVLALTFILGGAIGNLVDRVIQGYVVDFIVLHVDQYYFPAFNIADAAISIGAALLILDMFYQPGEKAVV